MFGGLTHAPAVELGRRLVELAPPGLEHVFFADSGSVAVEVAIKMALQYAVATGHPEKCRLLTVRGGYHGDTFAAMSVCDPVTGMHHLFSGILPKQLFAERPSCRFDAPFDEASVAGFTSLMEAHAAEIAAVIIEPIVQGAGGMWFYHGDYLRRVRDLCDRHDVLLILDEIATGFGRTGRMFACEHAGIAPDILCLGKALTGGMMTLAATLATKCVAHGVSKGGLPFMHGPTFMANPLACAVGVASLDLLTESDWQANIARLEVALREGLAPCRDAPRVADVRVLGGIGVVEMREPVDVAALQEQFVADGVWIRPFGRLIYLMPPYIAGEAELEMLTGTVRRVVGE
jgi:adenosylmethionine-8-amino-7-oxononanoate aminotransferase